MCEAAFVAPSKEVVSALKITKGKPFSKGLVFVNGKFIEPPYVVERYGNVLRINKVQITNPVIEWSEFLKTQPSAPAPAGAPAPAPAPVVEPTPEPEPEPEPVEATEITADDSDGDLLDDLFDDTPAKPKKSVHKAASKAKPVHKAEAPAKPKVAAARLAHFETNDRVKMMVNKINAMRTEIDASLRRGCFFCFGSCYARVSGDNGAMLRVLQKVPEIMKKHSEYEPFAAAMRKEGFVYFSPILVQELFANRVDYLALQKRWKKVFEEQEFNSMLEKAGVGY